MHHRQGALRVVFWSCVCVSVPMWVGWGVSGRCWAAYDGAVNGPTGLASRYAVSRGCLWRITTMCPRDGWSRGVQSTPNTAWLLWPSYEMNGLGESSAGLPLWMPGIGFAIGAAGAGGARAAGGRRIRAGQCRHCGYDLTGSGTGPCPECGAR